ncbi:MAG: MarR family winged helix-turn-helix transcriptional regulator [Turicibacter sp.]
MKKLSKHISISMRKSQAYYAQELADLNISTGQYMFIVAICEQIGMSQEELGDHVGINKSTVAKVIAQLEESGHVERVVDPFDKRGYNIYPTEKAQVVYPHIVKMLDQWQDYLLEGMNAEETRTLITLMAKVEQNARKYAPHQKGKK